MRKKIGLWVTLVMLATLVQAQGFRDIVSLGQIIDHYEKGKSVVPMLKAQGYKYKGWVHAEELNDFYGSSFYYKKCRLNKKGKPVAFSKGNSSIVEIGSFGYGPTILLWVYNAKAFQHCMKQVVAHGYRPYPEESNADNQAYANAKYIVDCCRIGRGGVFGIRRKL